MGTMLKFGHLKKMSVLAFVVLLAACGAGVKVEIEQHAPSNSEVIYLNAGESREFSASGPIYSPYSEVLFQVGVRAQWEVYKYAPDNYLAGSIFNIIPSTRAGQSVEVVPATSVNANRFEFEAPVNQPSQYYLVTYTVYRHNIGGTWAFADSSRSWLVYVGESEQTPPQWEGDFLISSTEDLAKIENYADINGSLSIMPFSPEGSGSSVLGGQNMVIVSSNIDNRELKYALPLGIRSEGSLITGLSELADLNHIGESLHLFSNPKLASFEPLQGLQGVDGNLMVYNNDQITELLGLDNINVLGGDLYVQSNPVLESTDALSGLEIIDGSAVIAWNAKLANLDGLEGITRIEKVLNIQQNPELVSISGLNNLEYVKDGFHIKGNLNVCDSEAQALFDLVESRDGVESEIVTIENDDSC